MGARVDGEFVVAAPEVLHECVAAHGQACALVRTFVSEPCTQLDRSNELRYRSRTSQSRGSSPALMYPSVPGDEARRYSPASCTSIQKRRVAGNPDERLVSTSYVERQNLSMRMGMRRFTRLTNAFSKKVENHAHAATLFYMHYNFARHHQTLTKRFGRPTTPAMAAGVADYPWSLTQIAELLD
jgi:hypothetical protein